MDNSWPVFTKKEISKVSKVLESGKVNYWTGSECRLFEKEFAEYFNCKFAVALSNGTVAIDAALYALNIGKGDEVIVTARTFIASASCIVNAGAVPIFADICENSQNIKSSEVEKLITKKTKAIMCVHLAGFPCEMDKILKLAKKNKLFVIEDCAQAHGAKYKNKFVGSIGDIGCWSFCQDKIMTTGGEGGMITTNNKSIWKKIWAFKDHGKSFSKVSNQKSKKGFKWLHDSFGTNWRMTEIQGAIGRIQLKMLPNWTKKRNKFQNMIWSNCRKINALRVPSFNDRNWKYYDKGNIHGAYKCYVFIETSKLKSGWNRDRIIDEISKEKVECYSGSCSEVYLEKAFKKFNLAPKKRLPCAKKLGETSLMFQIHPTLTEKDIQRTCSAINKVFQIAQKA